MVDAANDCYSAWKVFQMLEAIRQKQEDLEVPIEHLDLSHLENDQREPYKDSPSRRTERLCIERREQKQEKLQK
jgi:hypothetical protein